jgi:hypothetical protein
VIPRGGKTIEVILLRGGMPGHSVHTVGMLMEISGICQRRYQGLIIRFLAVEPETDFV